MTKEFYFEQVENLQGKEGVFLSDFKTTRMSAVIGMLTACLSGALELTDEENKTIDAKINEYLKGATKY